MAVDLFLSPLISLLVQKVAGSLMEQFCRMRGMEDDRQKLQHQLLAIREKIVHAEKREANIPCVRAWLTELRAAAYEASDVLDEALQQQSSASNKVKSLLSVENPAFLRLSISKKLKNTLDRIDKIVTEMNKLNFVLCEPACKVDRPLTCSFVNEAEIIGRDSDKEKIVNELLDLQCERADLPVSVLPIFGTSGLGKTTLAQLVYNDKRVKKCFEPLIWVCVSQELNVVNTVKSIIEVATNGESIISTSNIEVLQCTLHQILAEKKYLLVLDDVLIEDVEKWDSLKALLFPGDCSGSVVVVTTSSKRVASMVETLPSYPLRPLSEEDSWDLFRKRAFREGTKGLPELVEIGRTIVRNCGGSPRALKAIGTLLGSKREVDEWHAIAENSWDNEASANEISLGVPRADELNSFLHLKLLRHQTFKQVRITKRKHSYDPMTANFILSNSIYKWQRCTGFDLPEPHSSSSSLHPDLDTLLFRLSLSDPEAQHSAAGKIRLLTRRNVRTGVVIAQEGGVPLLNNLLSSPDPHIQEHAVTALLNLSICRENKARMVASGSTTVIVQTLKTGNMEARENAAAALFSLSIKDECRGLIGATWSIPALVLFLKDGTPRGRKDACFALFNLCHYHGNKGRVIRAGLIPVLVFILTDKSGWLIDEALVLIAMLASHPEGRVAIRDAETVPALVEVVKSGSPRTRENAAAVLAMLCRGEEGEMYMHQAAESGLHGPIRDLAENGASRGKRLAFLLKDLMIQYSCSGLEPCPIDKTGQHTDEEMALMAMLACNPEEVGVVVIVKSGCPGNKENAAVLLLNLFNRDGSKMHIHQAVNCVLFYTVSDLGVNCYTMSHLAENCCTNRGKKKAYWFQEMMINYFLSSSNQFNNNRGDAKLLLA